MESLLKVILENKAIDKFLNNEGRLVLNDVTSLSYLTSGAYLKSKKNIVLVASNLYIAQNIYEHISSIIGEDKCLLYPVDEIYHEKNYAYSKEMLAQRLYVMDKCFDGEKRILITHIEGVTRYLPNPDIYKKRTLFLKKGNSYKLEDLIKSLIDMSFIRVNKVSQSLQFALRGDILDIFSINNENPLRIEFFDDEIESIRYFDTATQTSILEIDEIKIFPATDLLIDEDLNIGKDLVLEKLEQDLKKLPFDVKEKLNQKVRYDIEDILQNGFNENLYNYFHYFNKKKFNILDYFSSDITLVYQSDEVLKNHEFKVVENDKFVKELYSNGLSLNNSNINIPLNTALSKSKQIINAYTYYLGENDYDFGLKSIPFYSRNLYNSLSLIDEYIAQNKKVIICLDEQFKTYHDFLLEKEYSFDIVNENEECKSPLSLCKYDLKAGFILEKENVVYLSKKEIIGYKQSLNVFTSRFKKAVILNSFEELEIGDYVVHEENGIGRYEGIVTLEANNQIGDYLKLTYANNSTLYIPLQKFSVIRKYVSREGSTPRLSRIGGKDWANTRKRIREQVNFLAERLIHLYAERQALQGFAFKEDDQFQEEFERAFPYELTLDQKRAVEDIKEEMEKPRPMDRLLCGDVGFGKTEVAFRCAFKAILSGKQVALLCPTTILAKQHYDVALSRFAMFGVNIALFSRFVSTKQQNEYIKQINEGKIHLIIGTHRLLSPEIKIPELGLLIVDEEQRFGVEHKERIKEISKNVDVLTLTATPIPRTLQMSLLGIRNLSQLTTAPSSRMPIQTYVASYSFRLAKEAIARELSRGGQVYYLHNRVSSISQKTKEIMKALPDARVGMVHAKMDKEDIDMIMSEFYLGNIDVLVCTSIVEAGLDVPNANTIIIEGADKFGLSQLYQIKGRVGRSNRVAYAYLFVYDLEAINDDAQKRLEAIKQFTELGSGIKIAERDLNIRGAGDILGSEQSGFIDSVGIDTYLNILKEVLNEKKGVIDDTKRIRTTNVTVGGYIPSNYALDADKIQLYQEIEACNNLSSIEILRRKMRDIYGRLPQEVEKILLKRKIDILSNSVNIESVIEEETINVLLTKECSSSNGFALFLSNKLKGISSKIYIRFVNKQFIIKINKDKEGLNILLFILQVINGYSY